MKLDIERIGDWVIGHPWSSVAVAFAAGALLAVAESVPQTRALARRVMAMVGSTAFSLIQADAPFARVTTN